MVIDLDYTFNVILRNATPLLYHLIQITSKFKQHLRLFTNRHVYDARKVAVLRKNVARIGLGRRLESRALVTSVQQMMTSLPLTNHYT